MSNNLRPYKSQYVNHHLLKTGPLYFDKYGQVVKLLKAVNTDNGLCFTTEIVDCKNRKDIGKCSEAYKHELQRIFD